MQSLTHTTTLGEAPRYTQVYRCDHQGTWTYPVAPVESGGGGVERQAIAAPLDLRGCLHGGRYECG
jgi:hypothetical protein